jgi:hypothetical protein
MEPIVLEGNDLWLRASECSAGPVTSDMPDDPNDPNDPK